MRMLTSLKPGDVCFMVTLMVLDQEHLCSFSLLLASPGIPDRQLLSFYLPCEFSSVITMVVYIPPQAETSIALSEVHDVLSAIQNKHPDTVLIMAMDFNKVKLRQVMPYFYQHVTCPTRGANTLEHCYTLFKEGYKAVLLLAFGKSDHTTVFLMLDYTQKFLQETPITRKVKCWSAQSAAMLQEALNDIDGDMFGTCTDKRLIPVIVKTFLNQKPWVDRTICEAVNARTAAYHAGLTTGDMSAHKVASYGVRCAVKGAKRWYRERVESHFHHNDAPKCCTDYARITANWADVAGVSSSLLTEGNNIITITNCNMRRAVQQVKTRKAPGRKASLGV